MELLGYFGQQDGLVDCAEELEARGLDVTALTEMRVTRAVGLITPVRASCSDEEAIIGTVFVRLYSANNKSSSSSRSLTAMSSGRSTTARSVAPCRPPPRRRRRLRHRRCPCPVVDAVVAAGGR